MWWIIGGAVLLVLVVLWSLLAMAARSEAEMEREAAAMERKVCL
jgi:hypothetical protein